MDIVSEGELHRASTAGVSPQKTVFSGVGKTRTEISAALTAGILSFNVESEAELDLINEIARKSLSVAGVKLRFNPDIDAKTHPYISTGLKENKFGLTRKEIERIVKNRRLYSGVRIEGLSIHIGSQILSARPIDHAFGEAARFFSELSREIGEGFSRLDLGGGLGVSYLGEKRVSVDQYCALIKKHFLGKKSGPAQIVLEPGRSLVAESGALLTEVLYRKSRGRKEFVVVDAGMNDLIRPALYGATHPVVPLDKSKLSGAQAKTDLVGPVCESSDSFFQNKVFPKKIQAGDCLALLGSGAYGFSMASQYNSRPRPAEVLISDKQSRVIRRRETLEDLIQGET